MDTKYSEDTYRFVKEYVYKINWENYLGGKFGLNKKYVKEEVHVLKGGRTREYNWPRYDSSDTICT